jgi:hypothetical protein
MVIIGCACFLVVVANFFKYIEKEKKKTKKNKKK